MYDVSQGYLSAIHKTERYVDLKGTITFKNGAVIAVNNNSFQEASLYINKKAVDADDLNAGSVYASELGVSVFYDKADYRSFIGAKIELYFGLEITLGANDFEYVPLGAFYVDTAEKGQGTVKLIAYDAMLKFDKEYPQKQPTSTSKTIYEHLKYICNNCGVVLGTTQGEIENMPWGTSRVVINPNNMYGGYTPCETYRDAVSIIAGRLGAFATIGRDNKLYIKQLKDKLSNYQLTNEQIFSATVSDCNPNITSVSYNRRVDGKILVGTEVGRNLTISDNNMFFDIGGVRDCENLLKGILSVVNGMSYVPSEITWSGDPAIDLGDYIKLPEYEGGCVTMVTGINWKYRGKSKITSAGKGAATIVRSSLDKSVSSAIDDLTRLVEDIVTPSEPIDDLGDHIFAPLKSEQSIIVTVSDILPFKYTDIDTTEG